MRVPQPFEMPFPAQSNELGRFKRPIKRPAVVADSLLETGDSDVREWILTGEFPHERQKREAQERLRSWYLRIRSRLSGLAKRTARAGHNAQVNIILGGGCPRIVSGSLGGHFTKGGTPIAHPSAYSKVGWSNMEYRTNDEVVQVGADWLFARLPKVLPIYFKLVQYDSKQPEAKVARQWLAAQEAKLDFYNIDEPQLESLVLRIIGR